MKANVDREFGGIRAFLWPIHGHEVKKLVPMMIMLLLISFNYSVLRNLKDVVVVTAKSSGAEVLPFLKVWAVLPMAILITYFFTRLSSRFNQDTVVYTIISIFLVAYATFAFILHPASGSLHPHAFADFLQDILPVGFKGLIAMFRNWTFTLFYVMCELWGTMVLTVLFWGFANEVTKIGEARRFYSILGICSNIAAIFAGQIANFLSGMEYNPYLPFGTNAWDQSMMQIVILIVISGLLTMAAMWWMKRNVLNSKEYSTFHSTLNETALEKRLKKKKRLSLRESFRFLSDHKYLACIAILVVSYNLVINLVEVIWKDQLRELYPSPKDLNIYMNNLTSLMGVFSTMAALVMSQVIGRFGWTKVALATPFIMMVTSIGFFGFFFMQDHLGVAFLAMTGMTPLAIAVFFGSAQNCLSKAAKYSLFDTTKEMAFIPLNHDEKLRGKAAIDGVGSRLGKSGGSFAHQGLLVGLGSFSNSAPYIAGLLLSVIFVWILATKSLGRQFAALVASKDAEAYQELADATPATSEPTQQAQV